MEKIKYVYELSLWDSRDGNVYLIEEYETKEDCFLRLSYLSEYNKGSYFEVVYAKQELTDEENGVYENIKCTYIATGDIEKDEE